MRPIGEEVLSFAVREKHPLAGRAQLGFRDLSSYDWVIQPAGSPIWSTVADAFRADRADFPERLTYSASVLLTLTTVLGSDAIAPFAREVANVLMAEDLRAHIVTLDIARRVSVPAYNILNNKIPRS